jgi:ABC-2 type transport system ATP-binding protein
LPLHPVGRIMVSRDAATTADLRGVGRQGGEAPVTAQTVLSRWATQERRDRAAPVVELTDASRSFGARPALVGVSLCVGRGDIHALLGPNGAGKTTLLRVLAGLIVPTTGTVCVLGRDGTREDRALRQSIGLVPSGDRTFYLRLTGIENLAFFGRLHGLRRRLAVARAREVLELVGLADAARLPAGEYSHGMQKRLSVARALLTEPSLLLVDEATHDLDPQGARTVRDVVRDIALGGTAVVWATQRLDEIRGFAGRVTLLDGGRVRFQGSVPELMAQTVCRRYLVHLRNGAGGLERFDEVLGTAGRIAHAPQGESGHYLLTLSETTVLGDALARLTAARIDVLSCREERSQVEEAFLRLTSRERA